MHQLKYTLHTDLHDGNIRLALIESIRTKAKVWQFSIIDFGRAMEVDNVDDLYNIDTHNFYDQLSPERVEYVLNGTAQQQGAIGWVGFKSDVSATTKLVAQMLEAPDLCVDKRAAVYGLTLILLDKLPAVHERGRYEQAYLFSKQENQFYYVTYDGSSKQHVLKSLEFSPEEIWGLKQKILEIKQKSAEEKSEVTLSNGDALVFTYQEACDLFTKNKLLHLKQGGPGQPLPEFFFYNKYAIQRVLRVPLNLNSLLQGIKIPQVPILRESSVTLLALIKVFLRRMEEPDYHKRASTNEALLFFNTLTSLSILIKNESDWLTAVTTQVAEDPDEKPLPLTENNYSEKQKFYMTQLFLLAGNCYPCADDKQNNYFDFEGKPEFCNAVMTLVLQGILLHPALVSTLRNLSTNDLLTDATLQYLAGVASGDGAKQLFAFDLSVELQMTILLLRNQEASHEVCQDIYTKYLSKISLEQKLSLLQKLDDEGLKIKSLPEYLQLRTVITHAVFMSTELNNYVINKDAYTLNNQDTDYENLTFFMPSRKNLPKLAACGLVRKILTQGSDGIPTSNPGKVGVMLEALQQGRLGVRVKQIIKTNHILINLIDLHAERLLSEQTLGALKRINDAADTSLFHYSFSKELRILIILLNENSDVKPGDAVCVSLYQDYLKRVDKQLLFNMLNELDNVSEEVTNANKDGYIALRTVIAHAIFVKQKLEDYIPHKETEIAKQIDGNELYEYPTLSKNDCKKNGFKLEACRWLQQQLIFGNTTSPSLCPRATAALKQGSLGSKSEIIRSSYPLASPAA